jgi:hypothetical protein
MLWTWKLPMVKESRTCALALQSLRAQQRASLSINSRRQQRWRLYRPSVESAASEVVFPSADEKLWQDGKKKNDADDEPASPWTARKSSAGA